MSPVVGLDFDNTLVMYDNVLYDVALGRGLVDAGVARDKRAVRDHIRRLPGGEAEWQHLQVAAYGLRIAEATLADGVPSFLERCRRFGVKACIISHKTAFASASDETVALRTAALAWMEKERFFDAGGLGLSREDVYFESTRREKVARIGRVGCTHFIDDLEETFLEDSFPEGVARILYAPRGAHPALPGVKVVRTWSEAADCVFHARD